MAKVTSKYQVTVPRAIADKYGIRPGDDIDWTPAGDAIRVVPHGKGRGGNDIGSRLRLFDQATERQRARDRKRSVSGVRDRGWKREDLYQRGRTD